MVIRYWLSKPFSLAWTGIVIFVYLALLAVDRLRPGEDVILTDTVSEEF